MLQRVKPAATHCCICRRVFRPSLAIQTRVSCGSLVWQSVQEDVLLSARRAEQLLSRYQSEMTDLRNLVGGRATVPKEQVRRCLMSTIISQGPFLIIIR